MKSKTDEITEKAFHHAMNFFKSNHRGLDNQSVCLKQLMELTGFDFDTCLKIQNPVLSLYMAIDTIGIGQSVIESNMRMVTQTIHNHLLGLQSGKIFNEKSEISNEKPIDSDTYKNIIAKTSSPAHGYLLNDVRTIDISKAGLKDNDIGVLVKNLQYQLLNLDKFDASNNLLGYTAVENLFYTFRLGSPTATYNIKYMNLSNNQIGDDGVKYIASHLSAGLHPNLRCLDVSGNNLSYEVCSKIAKVVDQMKQDIMILVFKMSNIIDGVKKQGNLFFGSKEDKQNIIKDWFKIGQDNGIDVNNVTVSKDIFDIIVNYGKLQYNFTMGYAKCNIVPENVKSFTSDQIIATASKKAGVINTIIGAVTCYFKTLDKEMSSQEGIQFITDIGLVGQDELINSVE